MRMLILAMVLMVSLLKVMHWWCTDRPFQIPRKGVDDYSDQIIKTLFVIKSDIICISCNSKVYKFPKNSMDENYIISENFQCLILNLRTCIIVIYTIFWKFSKLRLTSPSGPIRYSILTCQGVCFHYSDLAAVGVKVLWDRVVVHRATSANTGAVHRTSLQMPGTSSKLFEHSLRKNVRI